jgi:hypothetical protein
MMQQQILAAMVHAPSLSEEPLAEPDPPTLPEFASPDQDVTQLECAELPESSKTQEENAEELTEPEDFATSPPELAHKVFFLFLLLYFSINTQVKHYRSCSSSSFFINIMINNILYF